MSDEEAPIVRIAEALEHIAGLLEKMANPPMMVRGLSETFEVLPGEFKFLPEGAKITPYK